jgi:tRNA pseudouridine55 synthase
MKRLLPINKPKGLTPLQTINVVRKKFPDLTKEKIGFAGRLDPLAHGVLLLMLGEETTKEKDTYLNLSKEYEFEAVFGVATDTYDTLGLINVIANAVKQSPDEIASSSLIPRNDELEKRIKAFIQTKLGKQTQIYPPYSSKPVDGKPLYLWAREGKLSDIAIPTREIEIFSFELLEIGTLSSEKLKKEIFKQIDSVSGDFRQEEIKNVWDRFFTNNQRRKTNSQFQTARFSIACSSGTYIRSLVNQLGEQLGIGAITLDILRTKVGSYTVINSTKLI